MTLDEHQKAAVHLVEDFHSGDEEARDRVAAVWGHDLPVFFGLVRAQHVIALEAGVTSWKALLATFPAPPAPKVVKSYEMPRPPCPHFEGKREFCPLCERGETENLVTGVRTPVAKDPQ